MVPVERKFGSAREEQFLGALLGFAIGEALGREMEGLIDWERGLASSRPGVYSIIQHPDGSEAIGYVSSLTDFMLAIVESVTTNGGMIEPENINARLAYTIRGEHRSTISAAIVEGIELAGTLDGLVPETYAPKTELAAALRGVPVGLLHAVGGFDLASMAVDASLVARLSHGSPEQAQSAKLVASIVQLAARTRAVPQYDAYPDVPDPDSVLHVLGSIEDETSFDAGLAQVVLGEWSRPADCALAGAILGAAFGVSQIPQYLIDGLDARIYLSLAAPWFFRAAQRRAGTVIDLRFLGPDSGSK